ncbi:MAG: hypothetical protein A3E61_01600 [Candidatus Colwellbacteria bacterium RIFCSPHIGHO2_12_FULL_43_12]|uniref:Uncharacterized protein n=3 Tax=Candidatus Colwelliibacteriota TaxID=1817904 RepID=A0A1G1YYW7_9BACT|nr:MAG: hypothetical protein A3D47_01165 [Candidatus Colwellbacteria bacterium RIFCSPHIGHO2_02_FULL_43_15]OGY58308.1 MAG: hypothetical protein A3E61_01600 [Candidatus Colwellbacteria bacterium RIFCSPHIGHO2_12_FULL_43_12]OGY61009.1 MAG: hypothetical protein A3F99_00025 [Candidatus Colwellbacteria bacterium RIFCSPLOWO2_12_FULL_43_11]
MNVQDTRSPVGYMDEKFFAHPLEKRMAVMLDRKGIGYRYRVPVHVIRDGEERETEIDFILFSPIYVRGYGLVKYIEMKNKMSKSARQQQVLLKDNGYVTLIVTAKLMEVFEKNGFLERRKVPTPVAD